jgi:hypothetical protein
MNAYMRIPCLILGLLLALSSTPVHASAPPFDRPGIAFATSTLPVGSFDWEQGLPDAVHDNTGGVSTTLYSADTIIRYGLLPTLEVQVGASLWNRLDTHGINVDNRSTGSGDTTIAAKWAPTLKSDNVTIAFLGAITLDTGASAFTNGRPVYSLGATVSRDLQHGRAIAVYLNASSNGGITTWTFSPNISFPITSNIGAYVEAGRAVGGDAAGTVAGGGLTWLLHDRVQFDVYGLRGLEGHAPDLQAGVGVSVFWK